MTTLICGHSPVPEFMQEIPADGIQSVEQAPPSGWDSMVIRIQAGDQSATEELYATISQGFRRFLLRRLNQQDVDDKLHDIFVIVVRAIQSGSLRDPARLMGFVRTISQRQVAAWIAEVVHQRGTKTELDDVVRYLPDRADDPEELSMRSQRAAAMKSVFEALPEQHREVLDRFYVRGQKASEICRELGMTDTQFRLLKWRAKERYVALCRKAMAGKPVLALIRDQRQRASAA
jgi:RNA polymerase sigma-70 factor (ECF subfamily)